MVAVDYVHERLVGLSRYRKVREMYDRYVEDCRALGRTPNDALTFAYSEHSKYAYAPDDIVKSKDGAVGVVCGYDVDDAVTVRFAHNGQTTLKTLAASVLEPAEIPREIVRIVKDTLKSACPLACE